MVQKILRTMQDDLRELKENKKGKGSPDKNAQKEEKVSSDTPEQKTDVRSKEPIPEEKTVAPAMQAPVSDKQTSEKSKPTLEEEIKNELDKMPKESDPLSQKERERNSIDEENVLAKLGAQKKEALQAKDAELSELIKRVSASMDRKVSSDQPKPQEPPKPDKDREIKEIIERMSRNMKEEEKILEEEKDNPAEKEKEEQGTPVKSLLKNIFHKNEDSEIEDDYRKEEKPKDTYWEKMHETLKNPQEDSPENEIMDEIKKEIMIEPDKKEKTEPKKENIAPQGPQIIPPEAPAAKPLAQPSLKKEIPEKPLRPTLTKPEKEAKEKTAGIIVPEKEASRKEKSESETSEQSGYISPENRLIFGKQEYYSSMRKRIKLKEEEKNLEGLEEVLKRGEAKLSEEEEKKMLRHQIIKKYRINLAKLPLGKIIIFSVLFLGTFAAGLYLILPKVAPQDETTIEIINGENIAEIDSKLEKEASAKQKDVSALNYFDGSLEPWNSYRQGDIIEVKLSYDDYSILLPRDEAVKSILGKESFSNIPPQFLELVSQKYSIIAFKRENDLRLGLAFKFNGANETQLRNVMLEWEKTSTRNARIYNVMKKLFTSSKLVETGVISFQPALYRDVELKYINLPDTDTSIDYVIYGDTIFFTTSKDTTYQMIDLLKLQS